MKKPTNICVLISLIIWATVTRSGSQGAETIKRPVSARIEPKFKVAESDEEIGNVIVKYVDGTEDTLTSDGNCVDPKVSADGHVGWIVCELAEDVKSLKLYKGFPMGTHLKVSYRGKTVAILAPTRQFVEEWSFTPDSQHVVIKSRGFHGPADIQLFALKDGPAESTVKAFEEDLPAWAEPFRDW